MRPGLRIAGALLLLAMAALMVSDGIEVFSRHIAEIPPCQETRLTGRVACGIGTALMKATPPGLRGPLLGISAWAAALGLLALGYGLLKPLLRRPTPTHPPS